jgi:hypothetical protein
MLGFPSQADAIAFVAGLKRYFSKAYCQIRKAERLACEWEVKIRYFNETALETLMWTYAQDASIVATVTPEQAKSDIYPTPIEPVRPVTPIRAIAPATARFLSHNSAPSVIGRSKPKTVRGLAIE